MFTFIVENKYGQKLELTHNPNYDITEIDGLDPPEAIINTTRNANADGSVFNSSYVTDRQIIITLAINSPAEANRINLYKYFKAKFPVTLYYQNATRNVYINGYVKNIEVAFFDKKQIAQITVFCTQPLFNGIEESLQEFSSVESLFEFPFEVESYTEFSEVEINTEQSIVNNGDVDTGVIITIHANGQVVTPKLYNVDTNESLVINVTMAEGDDIVINTRKNQKRITLTSGGVTTNIIGTLAEGSTWFQLVPGDNVFTIAADDYVENMQVSFMMVDQYEGV